MVRKPKQKPAKPQPKTKTKVNPASKPAPTNAAPIAPIAQSGKLSLDDFVAYLPDHSYIFVRNGETWTRDGVNAALPPVTLTSNGKPVMKKGEPVKVKPNIIIDRRAPVHCESWIPGHPRIVENMLMTDRGLIRSKGSRTYNHYLPAPDLPQHGDAGKAGPWVELVKKLYPVPAIHGHIFDFLAFCVQHPDIKLNHAMFIGGATRIGKDTILEPVRIAVGTWNFSEARPSEIGDKFNGFLRSTVLRINEARDLGDVNRFELYEHLKTIIAAPPMTHVINSKYTKLVVIPNVTKVIITSNYKTGGIYLPPDDARHFVAWSDVVREDFKGGDQYWIGLYDWLNREGFAHAHAYLATRDLSKFDAMAPPPRTEAFYEISESNIAPERNELADAIDGLGEPDAVTLQDVRDHVYDPNARPGDFGLWLADRRNRRTISHRFDDAGFALIRNTDRQDGLWVINGERQNIYAKKELDRAAQLDAARKMVAEKHEAAARTAANLKKVGDDIKKSADTTGVKAPQKPPQKPGSGPAAKPAAGAKNGHAGPGTGSPGNGAAGSTAEARGGAAEPRAKIHSPEKPVNTGRKPGPRL
jgi:hypothetical protein